MPDSPVPDLPARDQMPFDVVIVGAGPAGLAAAIRLRQLAIRDGRDLSVAVLEKGAAVGAHILSGAILDPRALDELLPDWAERGAPLTVPVVDERLLFLSARRAFAWPHLLLPPELKHRGCFVVRLGELCVWLAKQAEALGVDILPGFAATELLAAPDGAVTGVATGDFGIGRDGAPGPAFQRGAELPARLTILAEGARGSLAGQAIRLFGLATGDPQTWGLGVKELWRVTGAVPGRVTHTAGWPLGNAAYGGGFFYELGPDLAAVGMVVDLDYANPHLDPFAEFQRFKTHPQLRARLAGGERLAFGARALTEGGWQSLPRLAFPGGVLVGDAAGFLNAARSKGIHTAMKSGMLAADAAFARLAGNGSSAPLDDYADAVAGSWLGSELRRVRNFRPAQRFGLLAGTLYAGLDLFLLRGRAPWTLRRTAPDRARLVESSRAARREAVRPDGFVTFDRASSVHAAGVAHAEDQPVHLQLGHPGLPLAEHLPRYDLPEQRICPAGVYELDNSGGAPAFRINAANCLHCKACEIKDPSANIRWTPPEGGGGPNYSGM